MSKSRSEEIISALWAICAVLCAAYGFTVWAWIFGIKAALDTACAIWSAVKEESARRAAAIGTGKE